MKPRVTTSKFEGVHGKKPKGYGDWAFEIEGTIYWFDGSYTFARQQAVQRAKENGALVVIVLP